MLKYFQVIRTVEYDIQWERNNFLICRLPIETHFSLYIYFHACQTFLTYCTANLDDNILHVLQVLAVLNFIYGEVQNSSIWVPLS
jgi:hypothetical protein